MKITESKQDDGSETSSNLMKLLMDTDSTIKSNLKESDTESKEDSLANMIASARKELLRVTPPADDNNDIITLATAKSKKWVPINKARDWTMTSSVTTTAPKCRGATFAADMNFKEKEGQPTKMTPAKAQDGVEEMKECVVQICIKIHAGAEDIQETALGLMHHCLTILHERDKTACFVNSAKSLDAKKLMDFPQDFTDFHDYWGKWDEPMKSFRIQCQKTRADPLQAPFTFEVCGTPISSLRKHFSKWQGRQSLKEVLASE